MVTQCEAGSVTRASSSSVLASLGGRAWTIPPASARATPVATAISGIGRTPWRSIATPATIRAMPAR